MSLIDKMLPNNIFLFNFVVRLDYFVRRSINMYKCCKQCGKIKLKTDFFKKKSNKDGLESICKECKSINRKNRYSHICKQCGQEFKSGNKNSIYCSNKCHGEANKNQIEFNCDYCGKISSDRKSHYELKNNHYCSSECMHKHQSIMWKGNKSPLYNRIKLKCSYCNKEIEITNFDYNKNKNHFCSIDCMNKYRSDTYRGENHPRWNPNLSQEEREQGRNYPEYIEFIKKVLARDNYTCQCCGDNKGGNLNVHHLDGYNWCKEKRTNIDNGITLCENCHKEFHSIYGKGNNTKEQFEHFINNKNNKSA